MDIAVADQVEWYERKSPVRRGTTKRQDILGDQAPDGLNFNFHRVQNGGGDKAFQSPRHHHAFQQIRWAMEGAHNYAPGQDIEPGSLAYFPQGAYYGPQLRDSCSTLSVQFGFGDEQLHGGKKGHHVLHEHMEELEKSGKLEDGVFTDVDPETGQTRTRDSVAAVFETFAKGKYVIPAEKYGSPILMHPSAFAYYPAGDGLSVRQMGNFYDHPGPRGNVIISQVRLDGGVFVLEPERAHLLWSTAPGLRVGDDETSFPELTCVYSPRGESAELRGAGVVEAYLVEFPALD
jgi:hypothetical protein